MHAGDGVSDTQRELESEDIVTLSRLSHAVVTASHEIPDQDTDPSIKMCEPNKLSASCRSLLSAIYHNI